MCIRHHRQWPDCLCAEVQLRLSLCPGGAQVELRWNSGVEECLLEQLWHLHVVILAGVHLDVDDGLQVDLVTSQHLTQAQ